MKSGSLLANGLSDALAAPSPWATPGSDEALGGALLTPIPWLQPNHHGIGGPSSALSTPGQRSPNSAGSGPQNSPGPGAMGSNDLEGEVRTESTETIDGPNGVGSIETVSVSVNGIPSIGARGVGVTQGELLRQEQRAGVVPVSQLVPSHHVHSANPHAQVHRRASASPTGEASGSGAEGDRKSASPPTAAEVDAAAAASSAAVGSDNAGNANPSPNPNPVDPDAPVGSIAGSEEETPHARGPEEIGPEDTGPQPSSTSSTSGGGVEMQGIDIEAAVGRKRASKSPPSKPDEDKMDVEAPSAQTDSNVNTRKSRSRSSTPKREAENELEGSDNKRVKEEGGEGKAEDTAMDTSDSKDGAEAKAEKGPG